GTSGTRAEMGADHVRLRILFGEEVDHLHVARLGHRAFYGDRDRHGVAVVDERRHVELYFPFAHGRIAHDLADRRLERRLALRLDIGIELRTQLARGKRAAGEREELAAGGHFSVTR